MKQENVRQQLFRKLKRENCLWSYDVSKMHSISDEALIEHVMLYLDIDDINQLFGNRGTGTLLHCYRFLFSKLLPKDLEDRK